jgi:hypothetical protein
VEGNRPAHPEPEVEASLAIAESLGLMVAYHPVGFGRPGTQAGWFHVHCPRGCHDAVRIDALKADRITQRQFCAWVGRVMADHDTADVEGS